MEVVGWKLNGLVMSDLNFLPVHLPIAINLHSSLTNSLINIFF